MVSQWRNALSRHCSMKSGSFFLAEIMRMMSSLSPLGPCRLDVGDEAPLVFALDKRVYDLRVGTHGCLLLEFDGLI